MTDEPLSVLVVTDDPQLRTEFEYGAPAGVRVAFAADSREGMSAIAAEAPSSVVVDLQSGSAGGYALARDMGLDDRLADIPIVILLDRDQDAWLARQSGARSWHTKPVDAGVLFDELRDLVSA